MTSLHARAIIAEKLEAVKSRFLALGQGGKLVGKGEGERCPTVARGYNRHGGEWAVGNGGEVGAPWSKMPLARLQTECDKTGRRWYNAPQLDARSQPIGWTLRTF